MIGKDRRNGGQDVASGFVTRKTIEADDKSSALRSSGHGVSDKLRGGKRLSQGVGC